MVPKRLRLCLLLLCAVSITLWVLLLTLEFESMDHLVNDGLYVGEVLARWALLSPLCSTLYPQVKAPYFQETLGVAEATELLRNGSVDCNPASWEQKTMMMGPQEKALFWKVWATRQAAIGQQPMRYLEYGSGGSTLQVARSQNVSIDSVESGVEWCKNFSRKPETICLAAQGKLRLHCVAASETLQEDKGLSVKRVFALHGYPATPVCVTRQWRDYFEIDRTILNASKPDLILIDGRFRRAVALRTLLWVSDDVPVLVHDCHRYLPTLLRFFSLKERAGDLCWLQPRKDLEGPGLDMRAQRAALVEKAMKWAAWSSF